MSEVLSLIFSQPFLIRALIVGILISFCSALLGVSLVLKRFSMIGDGLSHVSFGAMAIASAVNIAPLHFALPIVIVSAFLLLRMSEKGKIKGDAAIALISTGALAVGVMATSLTTGMNVDIYNYMFGSILTMSNDDVVITSVLAIVIILLFVVFYHEIFAVTFDENFAKATGTKTTFYNMIIAALTAVTIVIGMRMMGALLISALIIFPTVTSMRICKSYKRVVFCSVAVSVLCFLSGLIFSVKYEAPTGASVVIVNIFIFAAFSLAKVILNIPANNKIFRFKKFFLSITAFLFVMIFLFLIFAGNYNIYKKEKLTVVTTSFASYDFSRQIVGYKGEVIMLLSPGEESHTFEPTPNDILAIEQCDVFVYGGGESEEWVDSVLEGVDSDMSVVSMMDCVELCCEEVSEGMEHNHDYEHEHNHNEEEYDEHVWTSPVNAIEICEVICKALCDEDENNAEYFRENTKNYISELERLDNDLLALIKNSQSNTVIIGDRFPLRYFTERYSINYFAAFPGCSAQVEANPVTIAYLSDKIIEENIDVVFKVDLSAGNVAYSLSEQTGAEVLTLYSCHVISSEDFKAGETYISLMYRNYNALKTALS